MNTENKTQTPETTTCEFCGKIVSKDAYIEHILIHHPEEQ
jgi:hypothetical protein